MQNMRTLRQRLLVGLLFAAFLMWLAPVASASGRLRFVRPEVGLGQGFLDSRTGLLSTTKLDIGGGGEYLGYRGANGFLLRINRYFTVQDIQRYQFGLLFYHSFGRPLTLSHVRVGIGPFASRRERYHEPSAGVGGQVELLVGIEDFVDFYVDAHLDVGEDTFSYGATGGIRISSSIFRVVKFDDRERWR